MPRSLVVCLLLFGLFLNGCAGRQAAVQPADSAREALCWDPPPQKPAHPVWDWCKKHPWTFGGVTVALLVVGGLALLITQAGAGIAMSGMN